MKSIKFVFSKAMPALPCSHNDNTTKLETFRYINIIMLLKFAAQKKIDYCQRDIIKSQTCVFLKLKARESLLSEGISHVS